MSLRQRLIVTGATGKQGGGLIQALLAKPSQPFEIYAVTRDPTSGSARALASKPNVQVIKGDFDHPEAIFAQVKEPWGLFSMSTPVIGKKGAAVVEERQGKEVVDAAVKAGIKHIVYTSVARGPDSDHTETPIPHFRSKKHIEDHLKAQAAKSGTTWTILRPVAFLDNLSDDFIGKVFSAVWRQNGMDTRLSFIGSADIGRVAAEALLNANKDEYKNKSITLAADDITPAEAAVAFKKVTGKEIPSTYGFMATLAKWMVPEELGLMFKWFKDGGFHADVPAIRSKYPFMKSFEKWIAEESAWRRNT